MSQSSQSDQRCGLLILEHNSLFDRTSEFIGGKGGVGNGGTKRNGDFTSFNATQSFSGHNKLERILKERSPLLALVGCLIQRVELFGELDHEFRINPIEGCENCV